MADLEFNPQDITDLADKISTLQFTEQQRLLLLAIFAAAANRTEVSGGGGTATLPMPELWGEIAGSGVGQDAALGGLREQLLNAYVPGNYFDSATRRRDKIVGMRL
jgi:hypothetical protein